MFGKDAKVMLTEKQETIRQQIANASTSAVRLAQREGTIAQLLRLPPGDETAIVGKLLGALWTLELGK